ncbi:MAG: FAD-dependent oxidoreductase [Candidatus Binatia bacterium]
MGKCVAVFGGGMGGLSAAHELVCRGFDVTVYEAGDEDELGGKSASEFLKGTGVPPRADLPGEHGFRFWPGFYRHVVETMFEIPGIRGAVQDDLCASAEAAVAFTGRPLFFFPRRLPTAPGDVLGTMQAMLGSHDIATPSDVALAAWFRLKYLTSGHQRRLAEYDAMSWTDFLHLDTPGLYSAPFVRFEKSIPRTLSAMVADKCSARTIGDVTMQMMLGYTRPAERPDQVLCGPTSVRWITPWRTFLEDQGVQFVPHATLTKLVLGGSGATRTVAHAVVAQVPASGGAPVAVDVMADYHVAALPLERMRAVVEASAMTGVDAGIDGLMNAALDPAVATDWMIGAQFFLNADLPICPGHVFYPDSAWALTSVSQAQFWAKSGRRVEDDYGDGNTKGIFSVCIADWDRKSPRLGKTAREAGTLDPAHPDRVILGEVRAQLRDALGPNVLRDGDLTNQYLDDDILFDATGMATANKTPLLIHPMGSWQFRPDAALKSIDNLFLASDYVKTHTQLATMEGANEAARRAVNAILERAGSAEPECTIWPLTEEVFGAARAMDDQRHLRGLPHVMDAIPPGDIVAAILLVQKMLLFDPFSLLP